MNIYAHYTAEQARFVRAKPRYQLQRFAELLGWRGLQQYHVVLPAAQVQKWSIPAPGVIVYYATPGTRFFLQINEASADDKLPYKATVIPDKFGMRAIGWHPFTLPADDLQLEAEAARLRPYLDRGLFKSRQWRRRFKREHPELLVPSKAKQRTRQGQG